MLSKVITSFYFPVPLVEIRMECQTNEQQRLVRRLSPSALASIRISRRCLVAMYSFPLSRGDHLLITLIAALNSRYGIIILY